MEQTHCLTPAALSENPALGILAILEDALHVARLTLCGVHGELLEEPLVGGDAAAATAAATAYAFATLFQIRALEDTIRSYTATAVGLSRRDNQDGEDHEYDGDDIPF